MSNEKQETVADIVADIRAQNQGLPEDSYALSPLVCDLLSLADRIEAASKREREAGAEAAQVCGEIGELIGREATREKESRVGNQAKMRKALEQIASMSEQIDYQLGSSEETIYAFRHERCLAHYISECARAALSAPPRNCDVGTAEEQQDRFREFCRIHFDARECGLGRSVAKCPAYQGGKNPDCSLWWGQMPYEEGGAK